MKKLTLIAILLSATCFAQDSTWQKKEKLKYIQINILKDQWDTLSNTLHSAFDIIPRAGASYSILEQNARVITVYDSVKIANPKNDKR